MQVNVSRVGERFQYFYNFQKPIDRFEGFLTCVLNKKIFNLYIK